MASRSTTLCFDNSGQIPFLLQEAKLSHGVWSKGPPQDITGYAEWASESDGFMTGTEGHVRYAFKSPMEMTDLVLHWDNPFVGDNSYGTSCDPNYSVVNFSGSGDDAKVDFDVVPSGSNVTLGAHDPKRVRLLDVWGEGRISYENGTRKIVSGFSNAYNLNLYKQKISSGPDMNKPIPNLIPVYSYGVPGFPIEDDAVDYMTLMAAPITRNTAREMCRVFNKDKIGNKNGFIVLYGVSSKQLAIFDKVAKAKGLVKLTEDLPPPFNAVTVEDDHVMYGNPET